MPITRINTPRRKGVKVTGPLAKVAAVVFFVLFLLMWLLAALVSLAVPTLIVLACLKILGVI